MSPIIIGIIGIFILFVLFAIKVPIAFAMAMIGVIGVIILVTPDAAFNVLTQNVFSTFSSYNLTVIPFFVLMGSYALAVGMGSNLYAAAYGLVGRVRGGLAMTTILSSALFSAMCASSPATAATIGPMALPEMRKYKYDDGLSTGTIASAGMLGPLIPPSTILIVYGTLTEESIGKLFIGGIIPGIMLALLFMVTVALICRLKPAAGPPGDPVPVKQILKAVANASDVLIIFLVVLGGIFLGWFSPTQAGAIGAVAVLLVGLARRRLTWRGFLNATKDGLWTSCMILFVIAGAVVFGRFLALSGISLGMADWLLGLNLSPVISVGIISLIFLVFGCFMDTMALVVLMVPILFPVLVGLNINLIWFGVILVILAGMGVITPPVGVNVFVIKGFAPEIPTMKIFKGAMPFLVAMIVCVVILLFFPQIITFLPAYVHG